MKVVYDTDSEIWIAKSSFDERHIPKSAGFRWDPHRKFWFTNNPDRAAELLDYFDDSAKAAFDDKLEEYKLLKEQEEQAKLAMIEASRATSADIDIPAPEGLEYLDFQKAGISYCLGRDNALIADEMGLGKTVQALGLINADEKISSALIIVPAYLKINWKREAEKWLARDMSVGIATSKKLPETDVVIANYEIVSKLRPEIDKRQWDLLVADESHYLKNPKAQRTKAVLGGQGFRPIAASRKVYLTGTPILNRPIELWPILSSTGVAREAGYGRYYSFAEHFCNGHQTRWGYDASGASNLDELQEILRSSLMIRRLKEDVLTELPPKRHQVIELDASGKEIKAAIRAERKAMEEIQKRTKDLKAAVASAKKSGDKIAYQKAVAALKSGRMAAFTEISKMRHEVAKAKTPQVVSAAADLAEGGEKMIIFTYHKDVAEMIRDGLKAKGVSTVLATGDHSVEDRQKSADAFQNGKADVFVGTIKSCGTGLTLTAASTVIFAELDWTPAAMAQAEDRAHRIGQTDSVLVQHLVAEGSIDAEMAKRLVDKSKVIDSTLDEVSDDLELDGELDGLEDDEDIDAPVPTDEDTEREYLRYQAMQQQAAARGFGL